MRVAYLANVGTRDVQRQGKFLEKPRPEGAALLADYERVRSELSSPILSAGLRRVLQFVDAVDRLQLFVSDQLPPPHTKEIHREKDTLEFGKLLQRLLNEKFGTRIKRIDCEPMRGNPADYNWTLSFFAERLRLLLPPEDVDVVYVAPVGGADASNVALTINSIRCYRRKCQFLYVMPDKSVQLLNLHNELLSDYARQAAASQLRRHDYAALRQTLEQAQLGRNWHKHLCDYADRRTRFDFARADAALQAALETTDGGESVAQLTRVRDSLQLCLKKRKPPTSASETAAWEEWFILQRFLLGELFFNLRLEEQAGDWVDFIGRLFRMHEAMLRLVFELETRHSTDGTERKGYPDFKKATEQLPEFSTLGIRPKPTTHALGQILQHWVRNAGKGIYGPIEGIRERIEKLSELRNKSIIAHGYEAISKEDICKALDGETPADLLDRLRIPLRRLGVNLSDEMDPYATVDKLLQVAID